jgi:archaellin
MLSVLKSKNVPQKTNFKNHTGIDAITGKGNFDIGEYITLLLLDTFSEQNGYLAFLVKNTVIRNIVNEQIKSKRQIGKFKKYIINAKEEFNVSVDASLLICKLNILPEILCTEYNFYTKKQKNKFGWINNKFVANVTNYETTKNIDGKSPFVWRQGVKHDTSKVMELERKNEHFINKRNDEFELEDELVYGILKSSDLKGNTINKTRKFTIITQKKIGQETSYIKHKYPKTYRYLSQNIKFFTQRKSSIYKGKPQFSIFGIGDYSFKPYKVAISGMYKDTKFSLVTPNENKAIMLDDTCYFIGFEHIEYAIITQFLLNKQTTQDFIKSISFDDSKRKITKELLMRIDLYNIAITLNYQEIEELKKSISSKTWQSYLIRIKHKEKPKDLFDMMKI